MTIDEAIQFCDEKANNIKMKAKPDVFIEIAEYLKCYRKCVNEDYDAYNEGMKDGYESGIDDLVDTLTPLEDNYNGCGEMIIASSVEELKEIAEKCKGRC